MSETVDGARPGSTVDLSRRMDRLEQNHERLAADFAALAATVGRVELNQVHAEELNKLRFDALGQAVATNTAKLDTFIARIDALITGEADTAQTREARQRVEEYERWHVAVDADRTRLAFIGRLALLITGPSLIGLVISLVALWKALQ